MQDFVSGRIQIPEDPGLEALKVNILRAAAVKNPVQVRQELIDLHQKHVLRLLSNRMIQFVDQVAGNLQQDFTELLRGVHKDLDRFLRATGGDPCDKVIDALHSLAPGLTKEELRRVETYAATMRTNSSATAAFQQVVSLPTLLAKELFNSVLSAAVRNALYELSIAVQLNAPQSEVFHYLIWNIKWMPAFARLVSSLILVDRKRVQISTSGVILASTEKVLYCALVDFANFRMWDGSEMWRELEFDAPHIRHRGRDPVKREPSPLFEPGEEFEAIPNPKGSFQTRGRDLSPAGQTMSDIERRFNGPKLYKADLEDRYGDINV